MRSCRSGSAGRMLISKVLLGQTPDFLMLFWHWDWSVKAGRLNYAIYECMGIECNGHMQGLMLLRSIGRQCRLPSQAGQAIVYIEYIESAPWNIAELVPAPEFSGVGRGSLKLLSSTVSMKASKDVWAFTRCRSRQLFTVVSCKTSDQTTR